MAAELAPLVSRLEKVADRLESVANSGSVGGAHSAGNHAMKSRRKLLQTKYVCFC